MKVCREVFKETICPDLYDYGDHFSLVDNKTGVLTFSELRLYPFNAVARFLETCVDSEVWKTETGFDVASKIDSILEEYFSFLESEFSKIAEVYYCGEKENVGYKKMLMTQVLKERFFNELLEAKRWFLELGNNAPDEVFEMEDVDVFDYFDKRVREKLKSIRPKFYEPPTKIVGRARALKEHQTETVEIDDDEAEELGYDIFDE